jgi:hypothetical protein
VGARGSEQCHNGDPCPAQLQKVPPIHQLGRSFVVFVHTPSSTMVCVCLLKIITGL